MWLGIVGAVLALGLGAVLSLAETAVSSLSEARVETFVKDERPGALRLLRVVHNRAEHINLLVLLRTVCETTGAVLAAALFLQGVGLHPWALVAAVAIPTLVTFVLIGVFSRTLGRQNPYSISLAAAPVLLGLKRVFGFASKLLVKIGSVLSPGRGFRDGPFVTEIELREIVDIATERGIVETDERRMIQSVFDLTSTTARTVMVPRTDMVWIEDTKSAGQATGLCVRSGLSRLPVIGEDVDDIVGMVYLKDLVAQTYHDTDAGRETPVTDVMRAPTFVPDSRMLTDLLEDMQRDHIHIAVLVDEYGAVAGLISIEDILEEIVGEITDEYDEDEDHPIEELSEGCFRVSSRLSLQELEELFNDHFADSAGGVASEKEDEQGDNDNDDEDQERSPDERLPDIEFSDAQHEEVDTVAGLGAFELGKVPMPGAEVTTAGLHLVFEGGHDKRGRYIVKSAVVQRAADSASDEEGQSETEGSDQDATAETE